MQLFVKQPIAGKTLLYTCSEQTPLRDFLTWFEDMTAIPEHCYFIVNNGRFLPKETDEQKDSTLLQLGVKNETTLTLTGRIRVKADSKKLNTST
jgi:hypothetical protein